MLKDYGYNTAAWGKWHNTPAEQSTSKGPFDYWPAGYGFEYFYGFLAGEASQYEPNMVRNTTMPINPHDDSTATAITSPRTSPKTRSSGCANSRPSRRTNRSSCTGLRAQRMARTTS